MCYSSHNNEVAKPHQNQRFQSLHLTISHIPTIGPSMLVHNKINVFPNVQARAKNLPQVMHKNKILKILKTSFTLKSLENSRKT